jgi:hypothetical protein
MINKVEDHSEFYIVSEFAEYGTLKNWIDQNNENSIKKYSSFEKNLKNKIKLMIDILTDLTIYIHKIQKLFIEI